MGARGSLSLFKDFFEDNPVPVDVAEAKRKGRSAELILQRNECLVERYYYYGKFTDKRYLKILEQLSFEFFLSTVTIPEVINENFETLSALRQQKPVRPYFTKKWPHLVWPVKE